jgi:hypothetical protein
MAIAVKVMAGVGTVMAGLDPAILSVAPAAHDQGRRG